MFLNVWLNRVEPSCETVAQACKICSLYGFVLRRSIKTMVWVVGTVLGKGKCKKFRQERGMTARPEVTGIHPTNSVFGTSGVECRLGSEERCDGSPARLRTLPFNGAHVFFF
jgi:hypothetical protein